MKFEKTRLIVVLCFSVLFFANLAFGYTGNELVIDEPGVLGNETEAVTASVQKLRDLGIDAHVVIVNSIGNSSDMNRYMLKLIEKIPSWGNAKADGFKSNLVVFALSWDDKKFSICYGRVLARSLDKNASRIKLNLMQPNIVRATKSMGDERSKFLATAFSSSINETSRLVTRQLFLFGNRSIRTVVSNPPSTTPSINFGLLKFFCVISAVSIIMFSFFALIKIRIKQKINHVAQKIENVRKYISENSEKIKYRDILVQRLYEAETSLNTAGQLSTIELAYLLSFLNDQIEIIQKKVGFEAKNTVSK